MTRPAPLKQQVQDLRSDLELLRIAQERMIKTALIGVALRPNGVEVLGVEGPSHYDLGRVCQCELCGELVGVEDLAYELRLLSATWGPRYGYAHKSCIP